MKKILLVWLISGISTVGFSQFIKQGSIIGGGSFQFSTEKVKDSEFKGSSFSLMPWAGYLVIDNLVVGADLLVTTSSSESGAPSNFSTKDNAILFGPLVRYYLDQGLFVHGQYNLGSSKSTFESSGFTSTDEFGLSQYRLGVGYAARISDTVLFEPMIGYYSQTQKDKSIDTKSTTGGLFIMGGFTIILKTVQ